MSFGTFQLCRTSQALFERPAIKTVYQVYILYMDATPLKGYMLLWQHTRQYCDSIISPAGMA